MEVPDDDDLFNVALTEFARRSKRNAEVLRRKYRDLARLKGNKLYFKESDVAAIILMDKVGDEDEYTVTRTALANILGVDPRTVRARMAAIGAPGRTAGTAVTYRQSDADRLLRRAHNLRLVGEDELAEMLRLSHPFQLEILILRPNLFREGRRMPRPDKRTSRGPRWINAKIEPWARAFRISYEDFLIEIGVRLFEAAADPERLFRSSNVPPVSAEAIHCLG